MERMIFDIGIGEHHYNLQAGQRFYHNNYSTSKGHSLPDYLVIRRLKKYSNGYYIEAEYENHSIYTKERLFAAENLLPFSSLNSDCENPEWIFVSGTAGTTTVKMKGMIP